MKIEESLSRKILTDRLATQRTKLRTITPDDIVPVPCARAMKKPPAPPTDANRFMPHRMTFVAWVLLAAFGVLGWRLYEVQIVHHELWAARGEDMVRQKRILPAMRGPIRDSNGELLAHDKLVHDVWINVRHLRDLNDVRVRLAKVEKTSVKALTASSTEEEIFTRYQQVVSAVMAEALGRIGAEEQPPAADFDTAIACERREG